MERAFPTLAHKIMPFLPIPPKPESWTRSGSGLKPKKETTTAVQLPTMTTAQRDALTPVNGMVVYNTTTGTIQQYVSGAWGNFGGGVSITIGQINAIAMGYAMP